MARTIQALVIETKRGRNTKNGNARITATVATPTPPFPGNVDIECAPDSSIAQMIGNQEFRDTPHVFELNARGQIARSLGPVD